MNFFMQIFKRMGLRNSVGGVLQGGKIMVLALLAFTACKTSQPAVEEQPQSNSRTQPQAQAQAESELEAMFEASDVFSSNFTGFMLYDPQADRTIYAQNEKRYFTPASNTKLFTFYTGLKLLPDELPALKYLERGDSLIFWGTGDPSFLRSDMDNGMTYEFLKSSSKKLYYSDSHYRDRGLGPGWSWSDYQYSYSAEKSPFPMYGNMVQFKLQEITTTTIATDDSGMEVSPAYFSPTIEKASKKGNGEDPPLLFREFSENTFRYVPGTDTSTFTVEKPYHYTPELVAEMLSDTLHKPVEHVEEKLPEDAQTLYSIPADTAYKHMLQPSDNFIAEQLLLAAAAQLGEPLTSEFVIDKMKQSHLAGMPDEPQWVDGSGLSRYNLFTPRSIIWLLQKIDEEFESDSTLFELLAAGGQSGTIASWYAPRDGGPPYVYAKTGTLSNNHCLSGYLITQGGKKMLFSFMNNHYVTSSSVVKEEMEKVLWYIHENF
jgi:D-alanyl-D-alanine carboxypeptidase/D-alanyl-D-alanine-endopeptidase (penicillin-binding protein 4)